MKVEVLLFFKFPCLNINQCNKDKKFKTPNTKAWWHIISQKKPKCTRLNSNYGEIAWSSHALQRWNSPSTRIMKNYKRNELIKGESTNLIDVRFVKLPSDDNVVRWGKTAYCLKSKTASENKWNQMKNCEHIHVLKKKKHT